MSETVLERVAEIERLPELANHSRYRQLGAALSPAHDRGRARHGGGLGSPSSPSPLADSRRTVEELRPHCYAVRLRLREDAQRVTSSAGFCRRHRTSEPPLDSTVPQVRVRASSQLA
jgi:hypothetical protein